MGNTAPPTLTGAGAPIGVLHGIGAVNMFLVPFTAAMSATYATGGDTLTQPAGIKGKNLIAVFINNPVVGGRLYSWNGSAAAPTIQAWVTGAALSGVLAEVAAATNLSAVTINGWLLYQD